MEVDYFTNLPSEITTDILSRLSIRSLAISKSVCKAWRDLFDIVKSKIKTPPALILFYSTRCKIIEIEDEDEADLESHDLHCHPLTDLEIPYGSAGSFQGITANALLLLYSLHAKRIPLYIYNLITREYTELCYPEDCIQNQEFQFGFGVSKISGQYKVVLINGDAAYDSHFVYTLETGTWRCVEAGAASGFSFCGVPIFCNDNLHWIVFDCRNHIWAVCDFDVETECFSIFSLPPIDIRYADGELSVLRDCLCYSYGTQINDEIVIWMMTEYQVDETWTIEYKMSTTGLDLSLRYIYVEALKLFKDGDVLMLLNSSILVYYSNKTRTLQEVNVLKDADADAKKGYALIFNPSFLSLKNFGFENVISF